MKAILILLVLAVVVGTLLVLKYQGAPPLPRISGDRARATLGFLACAVIVYGLGYYVHLASTTGELPSSDNHPPPRTTTKQRPESPEPDSSKKYAKYVKRISRKRYRVELTDEFSDPVPVNGKSFEVLHGSSEHFVVMVNGKHKLVSKYGTRTTIPDGVTPNTLKFKSFEGSQGVITVHILE